MNRLAVMKLCRAGRIWKFAGELGGPAKEAGVGRGTDRIGAYQEIQIVARGRAGDRFHSRL